MEGAPRGKGTGLRVGLAVSVSVAVIGAMLAYHDGLFDVDEARPGLDEGAYRFRGQVCRVDAAEESVWLAGEAGVVRLAWNATRPGHGWYVVDVQVTESGEYRALAFTPVLVFRDFSDVVPCNP